MTYFADKAGATKFANETVAAGGKARLIGLTNGTIGVKVTPAAERWHWGWTKVNASKRARAHVRKQRKR